MNQIVKHDRNPEGSCDVCVSTTILKDHEAGGSFRGVLSRHVHAVVASRIRINFASFKDTRGELSLGNAWLDVPIRVIRVEFICRRDGLTRQRPAQQRAARQ